MSAKAESASKGFGADPLNLIQVILAKGCSSPLPCFRIAKRQVNYDCEQSLF
jgi:hypothetical protein